MDFKLALEIVFQVIGGLGIFLLGMKNMSEGMQAIAGRRMRTMINMATGNRFMSVGMGTLVTAMVQSSSVTTVMVIGLVNVNIMTLLQSFGVIMGANIGTTITGWILVLKIGKYGLPILGIAAMFFLFGRRERLRYIAMGIMGVGMIFFGLELMKNGFKPLVDMPEFVKWFEAFTPDSYIGVLKCCLAGAVLTAVVQSSSATLGITIGLATTGIINFETAAALVLGENIGTTITAFLASLGGSINARRASYSHILFNLIGVAWITAIFPWYIEVVRDIVESIHGVDLNAIEPDENGLPTFPYVATAIASTHTGFNVLNVLLFLPFMGAVVTLLKRVVPSPNDRAPTHLSYSAVTFVDTPALAIQQSWREILYMREGVDKMIDEIRPLLGNGKRDEKAEQRIFHREEVLDVIQKDINEFLGQVLSGTVTTDVMESSRNQIRIADEYESISDYIAALLKLMIRLRKEDLELSEAEKKEVFDLHDHVARYIGLIGESVEEEKADILTKAKAEGDAITHLVREYRNNHLERLGEGKCTPLESLIFTDLINSYRRIKDHAFNIAEVLAGEK